MNNIYILDPLGNIRKPEIFKFPGGEVNVRFSQEDLKSLVTDNVNDHITIVANIRNSDDFMALALTTNIIRDEVIGYIYLELPYIPYARQDRICNEGEALSAKVFASLLNSLEFDSVLVADPHSDVAPALINNCMICPQEAIFYDYFHKYNMHKTDWTIVSPDAGANKKIGKVCKRLGKDTFIQADKERNLSTGEIIKTVVHQPTVPKDVLIVDDICDGGRTFIELAKVLRKKGAENVALYVTHGIFSKGKDVLLEHIDEVHAYYDWTE